MTEEKKRVIRKHISILAKAIEHELGRLCDLMEEDILNAEKKESVK